MLKLCTFLSKKLHFSWITLCISFSLFLRYSQHLSTAYAQTNTLWISFICIFIHPVDNYLKLLILLVLTDTIFVYISVDK